MSRKIEVVYVETPRASDEQINAYYGDQALQVSRQEKDDKKVIVASLEMLVAMARPGYQPQARLEAATILKLIHANVKA